MKMYFKSIFSLTFVKVHCFLHDGDYQNLVTRSCSGMQCIVIKDWLVVIFRGNIAIT